MLKSFKENKENLTGKIFVNKQGIKAKIIEYKGISDIKLEFIDTGTIKTVTLQKIINGTFKEKETPTYVDIVLHQFLGKQFKTQDGEHSYDVSELIDSRKVKVIFEDGTIRYYSPREIIEQKVTYTYDKNNAIGKQFINYKGQIAKITSYTNANNVSLEFEDGALCTKTSVGTIKKGLFVKDNENTKILSNLKKKYVGYTFVSSNGSTAKVIDYINSDKIYVEFQDGYKCYMTLSNLRSAFSHPLMSNKNINYMKEKYEGNCYITNSGYEIKILNYESSKKVLIEFIKDNVQKYVAIGNILQGQVAHPDEERTVSNYRNKLLNKTFVSNSGEEVTVIGYTNSKSVEILFEDGTKDIVMLDKLVYGKFTHPNTSHMNKEAMANRMLGHKYKNNYGLIATCTRYENSKTVEMTFEDGTTIISTRRNILNGKFTHPHYNQYQYKDKFIVYKMLDKDNNIVYVGRSVQFSIRMYQHFSNHIKENNKSWYYEVENIQYVEFDNFECMCNYESYFINKYKPKGNMRMESLLSEDFTPNESLLVWGTFDMDNFSIYKKNVKGIDLSKVK